MLSWLAGAFNWAAGKIDDTVRRWVNDIANAIYGFLHTLFGDIIKGWNDLYKAFEDAETAIGDIFDEIRLEVIHLWKVWIPDLWEWIAKNVTDPLTTAFDWVLHEGATVWHYISNPDDLAAYLYLHIVKQIETYAWETAQELGEFFLSLVVQNLAKLATLVEDIVDAIF